MTSYTVIDLNDINIRIGNDDQILLNSPGFAVIKDNKIAFGTQAERLARVYPRSTHNDYWQRLSQNAIQSASAQIRHNADLAYMQLAELYEQADLTTQWLIAVPSSFNQEQLGLLLGLLKAAKFADIKLIDSALLASAKTLNQGQHQHLDMQLHQSVLSCLETENKHKLTATTILPEAGRSNIYEQCARLISNEFINQSRFDPNHNAETEQLLFEKIPYCLSTLTHSLTCKVDIEYQTQSYSANITREAILQRLLPIYETIYKHLDDAEQVLLSHRFSILPGFLDRIDNANILDEFTLFTTAKDYSAHLANYDPGANYLSELPALNTTEITTNPDKKTQKTSAITHILIDHTAHRLNEQDYFFTADYQFETSLNDNSQFSIRFSNGQYSVQTENNGLIFLNDKNITDKEALSLGDEVKPATAITSARLIKVT